MESCRELWNGAPCCAQAPCLFERKYIHLTNSSNLPGQVEEANLFVIASMFDAFEIQNQDSSLFTSFSDVWWELSTFSGSMNYDLKRSIHALESTGSITFFSPGCLGHGYLPLAAPDLAPCYIGKSEMDGLIRTDIKLQCTSENKFEEMSSSEFTGMTLGIVSEESGLGVEVVVSH